MFTVALLHRSLRLNDNLVLEKALAVRGNGYLLPMFVLNPQQVVDNKYKNDRFITFMLESLARLSAALANKLYVAYGDLITVLDDLSQVILIDNLVLSIDYTNFAKERLLLIEQWCKAKNINVYTCQDYVLLPIESYSAKKGSSYKVFKAFNDHAVNLLQNSNTWHPRHHNFLPYLCNIDNFPHRYDVTTIPCNNIDNITIYADYEDRRKILATPATMLSAYLKLGLLSIREVVYFIASNYGWQHAMIRQLLWHDYFYQADPLPPIDHITWHNDNNIFAHWCAGTTGFPLVDAAMRQLNNTGLMHNRARMIAANFLMTICRIDWRWGEWYFASKLLDYDPIINNANWRDNNNIGITRHAYFQMFNLNEQIKKHDKDLLYIKTWLPELSHLDNKTIINWSQEAYHTYRCYCPPIFNEQQYQTIRDSAANWLLYK